MQRLRLPTYLGFRLRVPPTGALGALEICGDYRACGDSIGYGPQYFGKMDTPPFLVS